MGQKLLLLFTFVVLSQAATLPKSDKATCSRQCTENKKFGYETGKTYEYDYSSKVTTSIQGASEDKAEMDMTAKVQIEVQSKCDMILKVSDVNLKELDPKSPKATRDADKRGEFKRSLESNPLAFSFQDGRVEELCPSDDEQTWALNIKRAIISAFQNSMDDFSQEHKTKEMDVTGTCDVKYSVASNGWYSMTIKKSKDTLGCVDRHGYKTVMQGTPFRVPSEIQSLPLVKSSHECQQGISKAGILQSSSCEEQHILRPFSRESSGALTTTVQTLKYVGESKNRPSKVAVGKRTTLAFEHVFDNTDANYAQKEVTNKLNELCSSSKDSVKVSTAKQFTELVKLMKTLDSDSMDKVHKRVHSGKACPSNPKVKKFFLDAIPMVGTTASLKLMTSLINGNEVTGSEADMWMTSLAFIKNPTKDMLLELKPLLTNTQNGQAMLAVSSMVNTYCKSTPCANDIDMINLVSSLEDKISVGCFADKNNVNNIIRALRAFGNAGFPSTVPVINSCLTRKDNPTEVRLAAAQAFRRMPCDANRNDLMALYTTRDEDSELRISAYLGLMACPTPSILDKVQSTLESEEVNQVGSFVWSQLTNLMETSSPLKQNIKSILSNDMLKKEFNLEKMKYSRNYEGSFFLEKLNTGAAIDSNLIWSSKSFLPRSAMTNLTIDLFGHSVNLFEIGGRVEGLEYLLESYFGPEGYFGKSKDVVKQSVKGISNKAMDKLNEEYGSTMEELKGSMYLRIFGNEMHYINSDDIKTLMEGKNFNILDFIINLSQEQDYSFTHSFMFLDTSIVIPTIAGFPLNISVDGSATVDLQASGKIDLRQFSSNPKSLAIEGKIKPSGAVEVSSMMSVDAFVTKAGMKMVSSINSATALEGHIQLKNGHVFSAEWKTPDEKMEIIEVKTSFFTVHRDETREQKMITQNRQTKKLCTGNNMAHVTGFELCNEISYPNASLQTDAPYFPLTGPVVAGITMYKRDKHTSYKMEYKFVKTKTALMANIGFNTPGSKVDREMKMTFNLNQKNMNIDMAMMSPWKKATFDGAINTEKKIVNGKLSIDKTVYSLRAALPSKRKSSMWTYTPTLEIVIPNKDNVKVDGTIQYSPGKTVDAAITINGILQEPASIRLTMLSKKIIKSIKGSITINKKDEYSFETRMQTLDTAKSKKFNPFVSIRTPSKLVVGFGGSVEIKYKKAINVDLTLTGLTRAPMKVFAQMRNTGNAKQSRYQGKVNIQTPLLTTKGRSNIVMKSTSLVTRTSFDYIIPRVSRDKVTMNTKVIMRKNKKATSVKGSGALNFKKKPHLNVNVGGDFLSNAKLTKTNLNVQYGANKKDLNKKISLSSVVKHQLAWRASQVSVNAHLQHLESGIDIKVKGSHSHNKKSLDSSISMSVGKKHTFETAIFLKDKSKKLTSISGGGSMAWNDKSISISNVFIQQSKQKYSNDLAVKFGKQRATLSTELKRLSDMEYEISNDISIPGRKPFKLSGQLNRNPRDFRVRADIGKNYAGAFTFQYKPKTMIAIGSDLKAQSRRIVAVVEAKKTNPKYTGKFDLKWDADREPSKRVLLEGDVNYKSAMDINARLAVENPLKNVLMNYNHKLDKDLQAHYDLSVAGKEQIVLDANMANKDSSKSGSLRIGTPLTKYPVVQLNYDLLSDDKEYRNNFDFSWEKSSKIAASVNFDKPVTTSKFHGSLMVKTPFKGYKSSFLEIDHDSTANIKSMVKAEWNKNKMQVDAEYTHKGNKDISDITTVISMKSTIPHLQTVSLNANHKSSGQKYQNALVLEVNGNTYKYNGKMNHRLDAKGLKNSGQLALLISNIRYNSNWDLSLSSNGIDTVINSKLDDKVYKVEAKGRQAMALKEGGMSFSLKINSPMWNDLQMIVNHQHKPSFIDSSMILSNNGKTMASTEMKYNREHGKVTYEESLKVGEYSFQVEALADYRQFPMSGKVNSKYNDKQFDITGTYDRRQNSQNGKLKIKSSFAKTIVVNVDHAADNEMTTSASVQYGKTEVIAVENRFRWDRIKMIKTSVVLPLETIKKVEYSVAINGDITSFSAATSIEAKPLLEKVQLSSVWNNVNGLNANIRLETPFNQIPYSQISLINKPTPKLTSSELNIEYLPKKKITLKTNHKVQNNHMEGSFEIKTPFSQMKTMSGSLEHVASKSGFRSMVKYTCPRGILYSADANYKYGARKEGSIDITWDQKKIHANVVVDMTSQYPSGQVKISSPFSKDLMVDFKQAKSDAVLVTTATAKYSNGKKLSLENRYRFDDTFVFTTSIDTPFDSLRKINSVLEGKGTMRSFSFLGSVHVEPVAKKLLVSGALNTYGGVDGNLRVETPFDVIPYSQMTISSQQTGESTRTIANIEYLPSKVITIKTNHLTKFDALEASMEIQTPFKSIRFASASLKHKTADNGLTSHAGFEYPKGKIYSADAAFKNGPKKEGSIMVATPYNKPISVSFHHQGKYPSLESHGELQYQGNQKHIVDLTFNKKSNFKLALSYKCPSRDKMFVEVGHKGDSKQFNSFIKAQYKKGELHQMDVLFKNQAKKQGVLTVKSPFTKDLKASFHHTGSFKNLKSHIEYIYGKMKPASADLALITGKRLQGSLKISTPSIDDITVNIKHKGKLTSFRNKINVIYSKTQKISTDLNFRLGKVTKATLIFVSPFKGFKKVVANVKHEGSWKSFKCNANLKKGKEIYKADMKTSIGSKFYWQSSVETPIAGWKKINAVVSHEGRLTNFKCHAEVACGKQNVIAGDLKFVIKPTIDILVAAQTPFVGYKNVKASLSHQSTDTKIQSHAEVTYFKKDTISADILVNKPAKNVQVAITTPYKGYEQMSGSFSHAGPLNNFKTAMNLAKGKKEKVTAEITFTTVGQLAAELKISTPFANYPSTDISLTHNGNSNNFRSRANILFNKKKSFLDVTFNSLNGLEGQLVLQSPYTEILKANVLHKNEGNIKSTVGLTYGKQTILDANLSFKHKSKTLGTVFVKAFKVPRIEASIEHEGKMFNNKAKLQASYGKNTIVVDAQMESKSDISGKISVSTPFKSAKSMYVLFTSQGPKTHRNIHFETGINEDKITADVTHSEDDVMKSSISIRTPFTIFRNADASARYSGVLTNFDSHAEVKINEQMAEADLTVMTNGMIDIRGSIRTPYTDDIGFKINHDGEIRSFKSNIEISYGYKKVSGQIFTDLRNGVQIDATIQTPLTEDIVFATSSNNDIGNFRSLSQLSYKGEKQHELEVTLSAQRDTSSIKSSGQATYNGKKVSGNFDFNGDMFSFKSKADATYNNKKIIADLHFDSRRRIEGRFTLKTPVSSNLLISFDHEGSMMSFKSSAKLSYGKQSHEIKTSFNHVGSLKKFTTNVEGSYNGQMVSLDASFDGTNDVTGKIILKAPVYDDVIIVFSNEGTYNNLKNSLKMTYGGSLQHDAALNFEFTGSMMKFTTKGMFTYNNKLTSVDVSFDATGDIEGKFMLKTPVTEDIIVAFSNEGSYTDFKTCLKITYGGSLQHDASLKFDFTGSMMKFTTKKMFTYNNKLTSVDVSFDATGDIEGKFILKTPVTEDIIVAFSNEGPYTDFKTCLKITYGGSLQHDASLKFDFTGSMMKFTTTGTFTYNNKLTSADVSFDATSDIEGKLTLKTPIMEDIIVDFSKKGSNKNFKSFVKVSYSGRLQHHASVGLKRSGSVKNLKINVAAAYKGKHYSKEMSGNVILKTQGQPLLFKSQLEIGSGKSVQHDIKMNLNFNKKIDNIQMLIEGSYNDKRISATLSADMSSGLDGKIAIESPWTENIAVLIKFNGQQNDFDAQLLIDYSGRQQHEVIATYHLLGDLKRFSLSSSASYNGKQVSVDGSYDSADKNSAQLTFRSPFTQDAQVKSSFDGTLRKLSSNLDVSYGDNQIHKLSVEYHTTKANSKYGIDIDITFNAHKVEVETMIDLSDDYQIKLALKSPFTDDIEVSASGQVNRNKIKGSIDIKLGGNLIHEGSISLSRKMSPNQHSVIVNAEYNSKNIKFEISAVTYNGVDAKIIIETPFKGFEQMTTNFLYESVGKTVTVQLNGKIGRFDGLEFSCVFDKVSPYSVKVNMKAPVDGVRDISFNLNFNNNPRNFRLTSDLSADSGVIFDVTAEHIFSADVIQGSVEVKTAILEDINFKYDISGGLKKSSSSVSGSIGNTNFIKFYTTSDIKDLSADVKATLDVNFAGITKVIQTELTGSKSFNDFTSRLSGKIDQNEIAIETSFKNNPFEITMNLETPFQTAKSVSVNVKYTAKASYIQASSKLTLSPDNVYEINLNLFNKNFRKTNIKAELKTPIKGHELMRWIYKHDVSKSFTLFTDYTCSTGVQLVGDVKISPESFNVEMKTPFRNFRTLLLKGKLQKQNMVFNVDTVFELNKKSLELSGLVDLQNRPMTARMQLKTPFKGLETSDISMSCTGDIQDLRTTFEITTPLLEPINSEIHFRYSTVMDMEGTAILATGFKHLEHIRASFINQKQGNEYQTHLEAAWTKNDMISMDASCDVSDLFNGKHIKSSLSITTPFKAIRKFNAVLGNKYSADGNMQSVFVEHNGKRLLDIDASYTNVEQHTISLVTRHPRQMNFRIGGHKDSSRINTDISLNWDTNKADSNMNLEVFFAHKDNKCDLVLKFVHRSQTVGFRAELESSNNQHLISFDITSNNKNLFGYNYDCKYSSDNRDTSMTFRFPSRSIMVSNQVEKRLGSTKMSGSFYWDADRDQTKKISMTGDITPSGNGIDASVVFEMPSIGQDVKLDSQVQFNKGSVIFDGKTELKYSRDETKTLILSSRLEDLSSGTDTNYSFQVGIKHPYTTVDVEMTSHLEASDVRKMASVDVKYLTVDKINKNFGLMSEIDNLRKTLKVELVSPIKSVNIQGQLQTTAPYKLTIKNMYDNVKHVSTEMILDPSDVSLDVSMNYDIENPQNVLHVEAKLADESGLTAEVFRNIENQRMSDTLINLRLKTSKILHTRVHWNPDLLKTVKIAGLRKIRAYGDGINGALQKSWMSVEQEVESKHRIITAAISDDMKPYIKFLSARISQLQHMRRNNEFYLNDVVGHFQRTQMVIRNQINSMQIHINSLTEDFDMEMYNLYLAEISQFIKTMEDLSMQYYAEIVDLLDTQTTQLSKTIQQVYGKYSNSITDSLKVISSKKFADSIRSRLPTIPLQQMSDKYNTVIYNVRESINSGLIETLPTSVYHMGTSAYTYWEIEENIKAIFHAFVNFMKKDIEDDFRNIRDLITDVKKTKVTVYDPKKGHFEMDIYLPLEMKSLTEVKQINNPIENLKSLLPQYNPVPSLTDVWANTVVPVFGAHAYIKGNHFTTFDGQEFDFSGKCSYVLARDFAKDKFSIILNYMGRQKKKLIVMTATQNVQVLPNGKVHVNGVESKLPYSSDEVSVSQLGDNIFINGQGFSINNNIKADSYDVELSHWFHGKTGGLLGVHDNERFDDMMTSTKQITSDAYALAKTWQVQDKCR